MTYELTGVSLTHTTLMRPPVTLRDIQFAFNQTEWMYHCPHLSPLATATPLDCEVSLWSSWGLCLGPCSKGGTRYRTRYILLRPANAGTPCPELEEQAECVPHSCMKRQ